MTHDPLASPLELDAWPDDLQAEVRIGGRRLELAAEPAPCPHRQLNQLVMFALVAENEDGTGAVIGRQAKLKARCAECGVPMRFAVSSARASTVDGDLGLVVDLEPLEE